MPSSHATRSGSKVRATSFDRQVESRLVDRSVRFTKTRRVVLEALASAEGPRSAAELHRDIRATVPLSSLYRSLAVLHQAEVIAPHYSTKGVTRYELAEWLSGHHHHLLCVNCGFVEDVDIPGSLEQDLLVIVKKISLRTKFKPIDHALEIDGYCARCG